MAAVTRQLKFTGKTLGAVSTADIVVNGVNVYSGSLAGGDAGPSANIIDMAELSYNGSTQEEVITVSITLTSGQAAFGEVEIDQPTNTPLALWTVPVPSTGQDDGRTNILINGAEPPWPADGGPTLPGGTPESPIWIGWCFILESGDVLTFDYRAMNLQTPAP